MSIPHESGDEHGQGQDGRSYGFRKLLEDVKAQLPIDALANDLGAGLKQNGQGLRGKGVCHGGDNPDSLMVKPEQGRWWCFRCNEGGDVLDLWMQAKGIPDAMDGIMDLAGAYRIEPTPRPNFGRRQARQKPVRDALEEARVRSAHRRLFRIFARHTLASITDEDEHEEEAERIWKDLAAPARMIVVGRRGA